MINNNDIEDMDDKGVMWEYYNSKPANHNKPTRESWLTMTPMDMVRVFSQMTGQHPDTDLYKRLIQEEYAEWQAETEASWLDEDFYAPEEELKELADLVYVIFGYANAKGWNLMLALQLVHANNLGRCIQPDGSIKRREDGKIIKNPNYKKVDLKGLV